MKKKVIAVVVIMIGALLVIGSAAPMVAGAILKMRIPASVGIIGGADGPTSIMVAGVIGTRNAVLGMIIGILLVAAGIWGYRKKKK